MAYELYDPAKTPCDPLYHAPDCEGHPSIVGPGGNRNNIENNEKGILETSLADVMSYSKRSELDAQHPRVGIYGAGNTD